MSHNEPQLREVREFHKTKFKENPKTQAKHFGFCKFNIFYKTKCNCDLKNQNLKKGFYTAFCETDVMRRYNLVLDCIFKTACSIPSKYFSFLKLGTNISSIKFWQNSSDKLCFAI